MQGKLFIYNTLTRTKEKFEPINYPHVGLYVCGPTVYSDSHLGHARPAITFDILFRYLQHIGYKVRYVRNITDVGHLSDEVTGTGEDKIAKKARLEKVEPMEVVQRYTLSFRQNMTLLNVLPPSIEPIASGHIIEQQILIEKIIENGFAYQSEGSVYFDIEEYNKQHNYGKLSGRVIDELFTNTRELEGQEGKRSSYDFALWKKASPEHLMHWPSKWSEGFPGWHLECSAMSAKYLGEQFDIHGGGMDLIFPHHECEIAQSMAANGKDPVKYWIHNNMITINGQKMARSLGNFITLNDLFTGNNSLLSQAFSPMTIRFFILQAHYRGTLDFSNEALLASSKGLQRLMDAYKTLQTLKPSTTSSINIMALQEACYDAMNDDLNSPIVISHLFEGVRYINLINDGKESINLNDLDLLKTFFRVFIEEIMGLQIEETTNSNQELITGMVEMLLSMRIQAKINKDFNTSDKIRDELTRLGIDIKDKKDGFEWKIKQ